MTLALSIVAAACGDSGAVTTTTGPVPTEAATTTAPPTTAPPPAATTTIPTTTLAATTTAEAGVAAFAVTQVVFGDNGYVAITNVGNGPGDLGGHWLCQRPLYFEIPSTPLEPGETSWLAAGDGEALQDLIGPSVAAVVPADLAFGQLSGATGEMALYLSPSFGDFTQIVDYVEWGVTGHGRSQVAVEAGIWPANAFVEVPEEAVAISATQAPSMGPEDWTPDIGV